MKNNIAKIALMALLIAPFGLAMPAKAAIVDVGNTAISRTSLDGFSNFTIVDTNNPVSANGSLDTFTYYAKNTNSFEFVLVDSSNVVKWISPTITPTPGEGVKTWIPGGAVSVTMNWNLGVHFDSTGTIPFDSTGNLATYTSNGSGMPTVGVALIPAGTTNRTYSFGATGTDTLLGTLSAEDFGVVNYDTGLGILKGYTAGFGLTDAVFTDATSVVVKLYSVGDVLLQTNTFNTANTPLITGNQISSPFDVSGTFNYATDGYWTNVREPQYGQSVPAVKVIATVTLTNGKVVTAENTNLTGDPTTIYPTNPPPGVVGPPTDKDQCKNDGWKTFNNPAFNNQGDCVSFVVSHHHDGNDDHHQEDINENEGTENNDNNENEDHGAINSENNGSHHESNHQGNNNHHHESNH
ncbi:MAG: hypothetical protein AAB902_01465 [Patescibacteria group bacterium]